MLTYPRVLPPLASLLFSTILLAQDPWARVPAMPSSCYAKDDENTQAFTNFSVELGEALSNQTATNLALQKQITADPVAMQTKLVAAMQKNPAQAGEIMGVFEKLGNATISVQSESTSPRQTEFNERAAKFGADFGAEYDLLGPIHKRIRDHSHELGQTAANEAIVKAGWIEYNQKYETLCAKWFKRETPPLLAEYKQFLLSEFIPKRLEAEASERKLLEMFAVPTKDFHSVATLRAVTLYLDFASGLFGHRRTARDLP